MTDQAIIIQGCRENKRVSQEKLYMQFFPVLSALCRRFFDDEQEVVTAINNGMLRVFKNISMYEPAKSQLITWVYAIVRNEALTLVRNNKNVVVTVELTDEFPAETSINPFAQSEENEVVFHLGKLSSATRAVCSLFYLEGYAIKEIALSLDMKEGTVKWHLSEGRKKLQSIFNNNNNRIANAG